MIAPQELVDRYGSPLYVYALDRVDAAYADLRADLPSPSVLHYSVKANPHPLVVRRLRTLGCRAEVSSSGELAAAREAGFPGGQCVYTGPGKTAASLRAAIRQGVTRFSVESATDYARVAAAGAAAGVTTQCLVRVNIAQAVGASGLRMTGAATQFGIDVDELFASAGAFTSRAGGRVVGAHFFPLSNARDEESLIAEMVASVRAAARLRDDLGLEMSMVNLGGGFAAPYAQPGERPRYPRIRAVLEPVLDSCLPGWRRAGGVEVLFESGRYLVGDCGRLVATVTDVKRGKGRTFVVLDTGIHHLGGLAGLGRLLPFGVTVTGTPGGPASTARAAIVGPLCTPADVLARDTVISTPRPGDLVEIPNTGAYGLTASLLAFLGHPVAAEVVTENDDPLDASQLRVSRVPASEIDP